MIAKEEMLLESADYVVVSGNGGPYEAGSRLIGIYSGGKDSEIIAGSKITFTGSDQVYPVSNGVKGKDGVITLSVRLKDKVHDRSVVYVGQRMRGALSAP